MGKSAISMVIFNSYVKLPEAIRVQPADFPFLMDNFDGTSSFFMPDYTRDSEGKWRLKNGKSPRMIIGGWLELIQQK
jgi:hypothetical protein